MTNDQTCFFIKSDSSLEIEAVGFAANSQIDNLQACVLRESEGSKRGWKSSLAQHVGPAYTGQAVLTAPVQSLGHKLHTLRYLKCSVSKSTIG